MSNDDPKIVPRRPERLILSRRALTALGIASLALVIGGGILLARLLKRDERLSTPPPPVSQSHTLAPTAEPTLPGIAGFQAWRGTERVTVLVLGVDERASEFGPWRTDTILVLTLDPNSLTGAMLSIPRDLWVDIPGVGPDRINTANIHGETINYPGGGPALAMATITENLGIPVDHYVLLNFAAFVGFVDAIDCISLDVPEAIYDPTYPDAYYGYDPFYINAGFHERVCGEQALKYARTRATFGSDFDRAARQQQVIYAVRDKLLTPGQLPALLTSAPELWSTLQDGMTTDMTLDQMVALGLLAKDIPDGNIRSDVLDGSYTTPTITSGEIPQQVLLPDRQAISMLVREIFEAEATAVKAPAPTLAPTPDALLDRVAQEAATVSVLNGTPQAGLSVLAGDFFSERGLNILEIGEAGRVDYAKTVIYDNGDKPATARYLARMLGVPESAIIVTGDFQARYDIQVVLGSDAFP